MPIFTIDHDGQEVRSQYKAFEKTQAFPPTKYAFFPRKMRNISAKIFRWWTHKTTIDLLSPQDVPIGMKTKHSIYIMVFQMVTSDSDAMPPFIFPYSLTLITEVYLNCLEEVMLRWIEKVAAGLCATQAGKVFEKVSVSTPLPTSGRLTTEIATPLIILWDVQLSKTNRILCESKDELKYNDTIYKFKQVDRKG